MELPYETFSVADGPIGRHAQWPPKVVSVQDLGYIIDGNGLSYPRDIGRSSSLGDAHVLFNFGDTFAHEPGGKYMGLTSSTLGVAINSKTHPTVTACRLDEDGVVPSFIPLLETEKGEHGKRTTLWCFGGIVELDNNDPIGNIAEGWIFYQKGTHYYTHTDVHVFEYTGVAKVHFDVLTKQVFVKRVGNPLVLFEKNEPRFGTFSTVRQGNFAHLFGHTSDEQAIMLARVNVRSVTDRSRYTYWDGKKYQSNLAKAKPIVNNMQHGAIYRSKLFEQGKGRDWVFVGCSRFRDSKVRIGISADLEGPFTIVQLINAAPLLPMPSDSYMYCMYPHPWAFNEEDGQLMITWSEGPPQGNVAAVVLQFAMTMEMGRPKESIKRQNSSRENKCIIL